MYKITANQKGTREIAVTNAHLATVKNYALFTDLIGSHGIVTEETLDKLRMNTRGLIESNPNATDLITLCSEVLFHKDMKAFGLHQLVTLFLHWTEESE